MYPVPVYQLEQQQHICALRARHRVTASRSHSDIHRNITTDQRRPPCVAQPQQRKRQDTARCQLRSPHCHIHTRHIRHHAFHTNAHRRFICNTIPKTTMSTTSARNAPTNLPGSGHMLNGAATPLAINTASCQVSPTDHQPPSPTTRFTSHRYRTCTPRAAKDQDHVRPPATYHLAPAVVQRPCTSNNATAPRMYNVPTSSAARPCRR